MECEISMFTVIVLGEHQSIVLPTPQRSPRAPSTTSSKTLSGDEPHQTQAPADQDGQEASNQEAANRTQVWIHDQAVEPAVARAEFDRLWRDPSALAQALANNVKDTEVWCAIPCQPCFVSAADDRKTICVRLINPGRKKRCEFCRKDQRGCVELAPRYRESYHKMLAAWVVGDQEIYMQAYKDIRAARKHLRAIEENKKAFQETLTQLGQVVAGKLDKLKSEEP